METNARQNRQIPKDGSLNTAQQYHFLMLINLAAHIANQCIKKKRVKTVNHINTQILMLVIPSHSIAVSFLKEEPT